MKISSEDWMQTECICDLLMDNFKPKTIVKMCINYIKRKKKKEVEDDREYDITDSLQIRKVMA
jgi:hypothetical protein